jgi:hypothetical protein
MGPVARRTTTPWSWALTFLMAAAPALSAQSPYSVQVSPLLGYLRVGGEIRAIPDVTSTLSQRVVRFNESYVAGLNAEISRVGLPLRLRVGASRTLDGNLVAFSGWESCGSNCNRALYSDLASAAATTLSADLSLVLPRFSNRVAPYGFVGYAHRFLGYSDADPSIAPYVDSADRVSVKRFGAGLELDLVREGTFWIELAYHRTNQSLGRHISIDRSLASPSGSELTTGFKLRLF